MRTRRNWKQKNWFGMKKHIIFTDKYVSITTADEVLYGTGLEADETMTEYTILHPEGSLKLTWTMLRLMKIFEVLWLAASLITLTMAIIRATSGQAYGNYIYITLFTAAVALFMYRFRNATVCIWKSVKKNISGSRRNCKET